MPPYKPPRSGLLPKKGKSILRRVYSALRRHGYSKRRSAMIAWSVVRKAGFRKRSYAKV